VTLHSVTALKPHRSGQFLPGKNGPARQFLGEADKVSLLKRRPSISLCMIVRNEEEHIGRCLAGTVDFVDEVIVTDTGSTDRTIEIARQFGANMQQFQWTGDFSQARNHSINCASGDWILVLDADECLAARDAKLLRPLIAGMNAEGIALIQRTYLWNANFVCSIPNTKDYEEGREYSDCVEVSVIRLFRNDPRIRYQGRVHELVEPAFALEKLTAEKSSIVIHHFGKVGNPEHLERKKLLYLDLGRRKAEEQADNAMAQFELAVQLFELRKHSESIIYFERAYALNRTFDVALLYIAKANHLSGKMDEAQRTYRTCLKLAGENDKVLFEYANFVRDQGLLKKALHLYQRALAVNPRHSLAVFNMGGVYLKIGEISRGFDLIKKAIQLNPDNQTFYENFGRLALEGHNLEEAAELLESFFRRFSGTQRIASILAQIHFKMRRFDSAACWSTRAVRLDSADLTPHLIKANSEFCLGLMSDAEKSYSTVLALDPKNLDSMMNLAAIAQSRCDDQAAAQWYRRLLDDYPDHAETLKRYGRLAAKALPSPQALTILEAACKANPLDMACLLQLGSLYEQSGRFNDAVVLFRQASQLNPKLSRIADQKLRRLSVLVHEEKTNCSN